MRKSQTFGKNFPSGYVKARTIRVYNLLSKLVFIWDVNETSEDGISLSYTSVLCCPRGKG